MRKMLFLLFFVALLGVTQPAAAQLRTDAQEERAPVRLYGSDGPVFSLNQLFSPDHFRMSHSYTFSAGSFGSNSFSHGLYTNTMQWQFNHKLAARVDVGFLHSPLGTMNGQSSLENGQLFLQNAEVAYRPTENIQLHFNIRQSPYGQYMSPYGYSGYGYGYHPYRPYRGASDLFWREGR